MSKSILSLAVMALAAIVLIPGTSVAGPGQGQQGMNMPVFADCDLNDDGVITEAEFAKARGERIAKRAQEGRQMKNLANAPSFDDIDTDDNGEIGPEEFAAHLAEHRNKMQQQKMQQQ